MSGRFQFAHQRQAETPTNTVNGQEAPRYTHSKLYHSLSPSICWKCRRPGHYSRECPLKGSAGSSTPRTFKSASARRHDQQRMQAFIFRKQFPFAQLQDTELRQELPHSVPARKVRPVMQQLLHKISRLEETISHIVSPPQISEMSPKPQTPCYVVSTQTVQPVTYSSNASTQTCDVQLDNKLLNLQSQIDNLEENFKNKSDECQTLIHDKSMAALQNQKLFNELNQISATNEKTLSQNQLLTSENEKLRKTVSSNEHSQKRQIPALKKTIDELQLKVQEEIRQRIASARKASTLWDENDNFERKCHSLSDKLSNAESQCTDLEVLFKEKSEKFEVLQQNTDTFQKKCSQLQDKLESTAKATVYNLRLYPGQTLRAFAREIQNHCDGYNISEAIMCRAVIHGTQQAYTFHEYVHSQNLDTIDSISNCNVAHLDGLQLISATLPDLYNCYQQPRQPSYRQGQKKGGHRKGPRR